MKVRFAQRRPEIDERVDRVQHQSKMQRALDAIADMLRDVASHRRIHMILARQTQQRPKSTPATALHKLYLCWFVGGVAVAVAATSRCEFRHIFRIGKT